MKIFLNDIQIRALHGVLPQERIVGGNFLVTVEGETNQETSVLTDSLSDTVSYADMADIVREEMAIPSQLLEHVAGRIANHLLSALPLLTSVRVRIVKQAPPISGLQCKGAGVEVEKVRR